MLRWEKSSTCGEKGQLRSLICSMMRRIAYLRGSEMKPIDSQIIIVSNRKSLLLRKHRKNLGAKQMHFRLYLLGIYLSLETSFYFLYMMRGIVQSRPFVKKSKAHFSTKSSFSFAYGRKKRGQSNSFIAFAVQKW